MKKKKKKIIPRFVDDSLIFENLKKPKFVFFSWRGKRKRRSKGKKKH
jgi:hypothetical protein